MGQKNSAGKYRGRVQIGIGKDGKPINKYVSASTQRELEQKKAEIRHYYVDGQPRQKDRLFYEYAAEWYELKKQPFISMASQRSYSVAFNKHVLPAFGTRHLRAITSAEIQVFINSFKDSSKSQITMAVGILKNVFRNAYADGIIERDPTVALVRPKPKKKRERRALTLAEREQVVRVIGTHEHGMFLAVLYYLGLRRGEALGLKWEDFDFEENLVHVQRDIDYVGSTAQEGALKTAAADRFVPLPGELLPILKQHRAFGPEYLFHTKDDKPWSQNTYKRIWLNLMQDCGFTTERPKKENQHWANDPIDNLKSEITPHYFRHNYVTLLYETGIDPLVAMKIVGHTDYQTTANIYTHLGNETLRRTAVDMRGVFTPKGNPQAKPDNGKLVPWGDKFKMKQAK